MRIPNAQSSRPAGGGRLFAFGLALGLALALAWPACAATVCNVRDHGARATENLDTAAILAGRGPGADRSPASARGATYLPVQSLVLHDAPSPIRGHAPCSDNASCSLSSPPPELPASVENDGNMTAAMPRSSTQPATTSPSMAEAPLTARDSHGGSARAAFPATQDYFAHARPPHRTHVQRSFHRSRHFHPQFSLLDNPPYPATTFSLKT